ncbi:armadillo-type protein, partial [Biscogniauxia mediterranea]
MSGSDDVSDLDDDDDDDDDGLEDLEGIEDESDETQSDDNFEGFSDADEVKLAPRQRENPYVAPTTGVAKYVPPSLRKQSGSNTEAEAQLRRRVQGLINRLTNDNMIGIIKDFNNLYSTNPRQTVTSTLSDLILALVCSPEKRPDSFFTMIAGFIAAAHKTMGMAVSAYLIQQLVEVFDKHYEAASGDQSDAASKHLIALLAELYNMQVIGCNLVFDYVRLYLENLSELNTELLLKIIQLSGPSLRREDPHALGDIVGRIKPGNTKNMSVRTSFMIDEMKKLQSSKTKAVARNKDLAEQRTQIRKRIGTLGGTQDVQPLRVGLKDIQDADKRGKWWLVGASWSGNKADGNEDGRKDLKDQDQVDETITQVDDDLGIPDLWQLAREQGFNTEIRQRIFVALHAATDYENADLLIRKLRLNKHQRKEIPEVIVRSGERQSQYNHYYTLVASRFTGDRELGFQFRRCITTRFKKMGEDIDTGDGDDMDDMDEAADYDVRWVYNTAKMYGSLVASRSVKLIDIIKHRNLAALQEKTHMFVEVMFITILQESKSDTLKDVFGGLDEHVGRGVQYFLKKHVRKTDLLKEKREKKTVKKNCNVAVEILESVQATALL